MSQHALTLHQRYPYPRRRVIRTMLQVAARAAFLTLTELEVIGAEHFPRSGPLIVVANHFNFADPAAIVRIAPWPIEFLGGFNFVDGPAIAHLLPRLWGYYAVRRGAVSRSAIRAADAVLGQRGVLGIFPEGGSWAQVLRPARPGTAYLAARSGARILPIGIDGMPHIFPSLRQRRGRARVTVRVGQPFGPFNTNGRGQAGRADLEAIGHEIMRQIASLLPEERRGVYATDPLIRAAAQEAAIYPYENLYDQFTRQQA
ncbi:MAG: 1-acyl-sn-glycerol-3-phosphate acyltransferase [Anaerolineae bacterium]|nr:1-acyl-sn-glycerol-3-phosphate acyltransferase [Anaerolineae bacterium]